MTTPSACNHERVSASGHNVRNTCARQPLGILRRLGLLDDRQDKSSWPSAFAHQN